MEPITDQQPLSFGDIWRSKPDVREKFYQLTPDQQIKFLQASVPNFPTEPDKQQKFIDAITQMHLQLSQASHGGRFEVGQPASISPEPATTVPQILKRDISDVGKQLLATGQDVATSVGKVGGKVATGTLEMFKDPANLYAMAFAMATSMFGPEAKLSELVGRNVSKVPLKSLIGSAAAGGVTGESAKIVDEAAKKQLLDTSTQSLARRLATAGIEQAGFEAVASLAVLPFVAFRGALQKRAVKDYARILSTMRGFGVDIPVAHLTEFAPLDIIHNFTAGSWSGQKAMADYLTKVVRADGYFYDGMLGYITDSIKQMDARDAGKLLGDLVTNGKVVQDAFINQAYKVVEELDQGGVTINVLPLLPDLMKLESAFANISYFKVHPELRDLFKSVKGFLPTEENAKASVISFSDAQLLRSLMLEVKEGFGNAGKGRVRHAYGQAIEQLDNMMEEAAKNFRPSAAKIWREANRLRKQKSDIFESKIAKSIFDVIDKKPQALEEVVKTINQVGDAQAVRNLKSLIVHSSKLTGTPVTNTWKQVQAQYIKNLFDTAAATAAVDTTGREAAQLSRFTRPAASVPGILNPEKLLTLLKDPARRTMHEGFLDANIIRNVREFAEASMIAKAKQPGGGGMAAQLMQAGVLLTAISEFGTGFLSKALGATDETSPQYKRKIYGTAAMFIIAPHIMARMLTSRSATRWLLEGMKTPVASHRAIAVASRIAAYALKSGGQFVSVPSQDEEFSLSDFARQNVSAQPDFQLP